MPVITDDDLAEIILKQLPDLLSRKPDLQMPLYRAFLSSFADKGDFGRLRQEVAELRQETQDGFGDVRQQFKQVDQQFEQVNQRFDGVDQRLDGVDQRFDGVDQRFDGVDQRLDGVDQRFDGVDQRLDGLDQRFDGVDQRFNSLETEMRDGFKGVYQAIDRLGARWGIRNESLFRETVSSLLEETYGVNVEQKKIGGEQFDLVISNGEHILVEIAASVRQNIQERLERKRDLYIQKTGITPTRFILAVGAIHSRRSEALRAAGFDVLEPEEEYLH